MFMRQKLALGVLTAAIMVCLAGCRSDEENLGAEIDKAKLAEAKPTAERPRTYFPPSCQQADQQLNAFIQRILKTCEEGDYDGFSQLLGTTETPPSYDDFGRLWMGIREIAVKSVRTSQEEPPQYFVHAIAKLRKPDTDNRNERDIVIRIFREMGEWRIGGAHKDIARKILVADTQPDSAPAGEPSPSAAPERPGDAKPGSAAPQTGPAVYNNKTTAHQG